MLNMICCDAFACFPCGAQPTLATVRIGERLNAYSGCYERVKLPVQIHIYTSANMSSSMLVRIPYGTRCQFGDALISDSSSGGFRSFSSI